MSSPATSSSTPVRVALNAFQVLMRRWAKMHPYNAGQVMRVSGAPDRERWKTAVDAVIHDLRLGTVQWVRGDRLVEFQPVEGVEVESFDGGFEEFFNRELNHPFSKGAFPIRFFLVPAPPVEGSGEASHYMAAVYDHWIGDSRAMRELMQRIFERYQRPVATRERPHLPALTLQAPRFRDVFRKYAPLLPPWRSSLESLKGILRHRNAYRLNLYKPLDFTSNFFYRELPRGLINRLYAFAKAQDASVNDLFIAVIAQTMGDYTAWDRLTRKVRLLHFAHRKVGIGTIVDIRHAAAEPIDNVFNLYLSSFTVVMDNPEKTEIGPLTRRVATESRELKQPQACVNTFYKLVNAKFWYDVVGDRKLRAKMMHKNVSVVAGISNVNMTKSWVNPAEREAGVPQILDYLRISPTGPLSPVVFTLTTIGDRLSLCVTFRTTCMFPEAALKIVNDFMDRLGKIGATE